jgi:hypothetical protein
MNYYLIQTPNSRYLHLTSHGFSKDWMGLIAKVNAFIGQQPKLSFASEANLLYFFESPDNDHFFESISWIGKEIIGMPQIDSSGDFKVFDLDRGQSYRFKLNIDEDKTLLFPDRLTKFFQKAKESLMKNGIEPVSTWRVVIFDENKEGSLKIDVFMDFFSDDR